MAHLIFILSTFALLLGFFVVTGQEKSRGARVFARARARLDERVARVEFIVSHVDFEAFARDEIRRAVSRTSHALVHLSLIAVRTVERLLTRLVRRLRPPHVIDTTSRENARPFVKTLADFKDRLKATHPEISDIP